MKLSIIIPVYNVEKYVAKCLDSVLNQGLDANDYEIIVVNDGSPDGSLKILESYAKKHRHIQIINKENGGLSSARNCGMDHAKGKYIYFIDSDDFLISNSLKIFVDTCEHHDLDVLTFLCTTFTSLTPESENFWESVNSDFSLENNMLTPIVSGEDYIAYQYYRNEACLYISKREHLEGLGYRFPEGRFLEDAIFTLKTFLKAERIAHLKLDAYRYRLTPGSILNKTEPNHYQKLIRDMQGAASAFDPIIKTLENKISNPDCIKRIKARQQSIVFFSMMRMLKSTMRFTEVKKNMKKMVSVNAYPLDSLLGKDYNGIKYQILVRLFKTERRFYFFFRLLNPIFKFRNKFLN